MKWVACAIVGDGEEGGIETGHVDRASVQHLFGPQAERVAVDASVSCRDAVVSLERLNLAEIDCRQVGGAFVVVDGD